MLFILLIKTVPSYAGAWRNIASGIEYQDIGANIFNPWSHIHVFRIDLKNNQFDLIFADDLSRPHASIHEFAQHSKALIALNGGFFDKKFRPLGLRISNQHLENPLKRISWWGIFYIKNQKPYLTSLRQYKHDKKIDFALQSGPRLIINGRIPSLKAGIAERSALGITKDNRVIVLVTENSPMSTTNLAELMQSPPLECRDALNLDGGSSSQLTADIDSFQVNVHNFSHISDAIVIRGLNSSP
ncbi:Exopolysaccharide biosynthesis protein related to N-acetylglucosamine-1-phosphodiester alpha-N-acetylglucosaminidase [Legionella londiniensis]|uniref:Phosphodiester glycosidase domain-containing protein n=1 Tax=Legionella londiniensis TaxID=45068 RepID=A0A0W0VNT6_9GAMM|nr:hypothetical protein Llon_0869 [Legionella londiniensis]STX93461.1 Exopolysaccharide biosynthesis protein related to N-acetylglucosamine-1-phosphodiester alpha-N-acetylglucosaminidase [Legionella londiniensis]